MTSHRIGLVHAVSVAIEPIREAFARLWPGAYTTNLLDDSLSPDLAAAGRITPEITRRMVALAKYSAEAGADGVLFTCSAFGTAIDKAKAELPIPVLKPNEAMIDEALDTGRRVALLATFEPTIASMRSEFESAAEARGVNLNLLTRHVAGAIEALQGGRTDEHDRLIAEAAAEVADFDALILGQFSMARARNAIDDVPGRRIITSPDSAVARMKSLLGA